VTIAGTLTGSESGRLAIVLTGQPADGGGVELTASQVSLGPPGAPSEYRGPVSRLQGSTVVASLSSAAGAAVAATVVLQLGGPNGTVTGTVDVTA
jgi:hypothetical protein